MNTHFKLKLTGGPTRRLSFNDQPSWTLLAERIGTMFSIPELDKVAVSYIDSDGDEVTLSTEEELQDFYLSCHTPGDVVKFTVEDLRNPRRTSRSSPQTPPHNNIRNTFGGSISEGLPFNIDEDWQHFPSGLGGLFSANGAGDDSSLHAFVEEIESGASTVSGPQHDDTTSISDTESHASTILPPRVDKGKGRAQDIDDASSTASLLEEKVFEKPDIHVYDKASENRSRSSRRSSTSFIGKESTPKVHVQDVPPSVPSTPSTIRSAAPSRPISMARTSQSLPPTSIPVLASEELEVEAEDAEDPPLPALDSASLEHANASLSVDVANLLGNLANVFASHPELSEGFRNILQNAASGNYWTAQRDAMSQAADIARSVTEELSRADQEAGRRVSDALGLFFRTVSQAVGSIPTTTTAGAPPTPSAPAPAADSRWGQREYSSWGRGGRGSWGGRFGHHWENNRGSFFGAPFVPPHLPPSFTPGGFGMPPPVPPPPGSHGIPPPGPLPDMSGGRPLSPPRSRPLSPPGPPGPRLGTRGTYRRGSPLHHSYPDRDRLLPGSYPWEPRPSMEPRPPMEPEQSRNRQSSTELRNQVEAAKLLYKAEKERYRQNREERRNEKARKMLELMGDISLERAQAITEAAAIKAPTDPVKSAPVAGPSNPNPTAPGPVFREPESSNRAETRSRSQIVSNARGSFPQFEMVGVESSPAGGPPRRSHTVPNRGGHGHHHLSRRFTVEPGDPATRAVRRINRKLTDMGFSDNAHPDLTGKIRAAVPADGNLTKDKEDNIITNLLEDLVAPPRTPAAAGAGAGASGSLV